MYTIHVEFAVRKIMVFEMSHAHQGIYFMKKYSNLFDQMHSKNMNIVKYYNSKLFF